MIETIKKYLARNKYGCIIFIIGVILCISGVAISLIWRPSFASASEKISSVVITIGIGIPFILTGINMILRPLKKDYIYITENKILFVGFVGFIMSIISVIFFSILYPEDWYYPRLYIVSIPYTVGIFLLVVNAFFDVSVKEIEMTGLRIKLEEANKIIKEKEDIGKEEAMPDYIEGFADKLRENIDKGTKELHERTMTIIKEYRYGNEQLHNEVQKFKQRIEKEKAELEEQANERIIKNLIKPFSIIDEALKQCKDDTKDINYIIDGIEVIKKELYKVLENERVETIEPIPGENFDPTKHDAVEVIETDKFSENTIVDRKEIGCKFESGKIIKKAEVKVSPKKRRMR